MDNELDGNYTGIKVITVLNGEEVAECVNEALILDVQMVDRYSGAEVQVTHEADYGMYHFTVTGVDVNSTYCEVVLRQSLDEWGYRSLVMDLLGDGTAASSFSGAGDSELAQMVENGYYRVVEFSGYSVSPDGNSLSYTVTYCGDWTAFAPEAPEQTDYRAWYEVEADGTLFIKTNIDSSDWGGYSMVYHRRTDDGSNSFGSQSGSYGIIEYDCTGGFSGYDAGTVITNTDFYVFKGTSTRNEYWDLRDSLGSHEAAVEALGDKLVGEFKLDTQVSVEDMSYSLNLERFEIVYDETTQEETYNAYISSEIEEIGVYALLYRPETGDSNAGRSHIKKGDGMLTFTRDRGHFADSGASGYFQVTYCIYSMEDDGTVICRKAESNEIYHVFE